MGQVVIIKSSKSGINLVLDPEMEFETLLSEILNKFQQSEKFFANAEIAISFEGRTLSDTEQYRIVDAIMSHTTIKVLCIVDNDEIREAILQQKIQEKNRTEEQRLPIRGVFYHGSLKPKEQVESEDAVIVLGNVPKGASIVSKSSIIVLGNLAGMAYAGMDGDSRSFIAALHFAPEQFNIAGIYGEMPKERGTIFLKRNKTAESKLAFLSDGLMNVCPLSEGMDNYI